MKVRVAVFPVLVAALVLGTRTIGTGEWLTIAS